ncbi:pancreatic eIF-2alpha kinase isoform 2-T2 [Glossina fuscipes fuscipes]
MLQSIKTTHLIKHSKFVSHGSYILLWCSLKLCFIYLFFFLFLATSANIFHFREPQVRAIAAAASTINPPVMRLAVGNILAEANAKTLVENQQRPAIPYCNDEKHERTIGQRLLYVTTLDGRLSALDIIKGGKLRWSITTEPGPLISSSIHRLELTNNGRFVRMIPSLSGGIYKFDGESIDPIPITTDNLLSSSAKFSDDLVISGGKETRTYGVSARTGKLLYECSMNGCINSTEAELNNSTRPQYVNKKEDDFTENESNEDYLMEHDPLLDDVIVVRRLTQTVRAIETRSGLERWNFSVGQHELDLIRSPGCHEREYSDLERAIIDLDIKIIVPEGIICAFSKSNPSSMLWKHKFNHPIVSAWKLGLDDHLEAVDMFGSARWLWDREEEIYDLPLPTTNPSIYLGMYEKQLYIQESVNLRKEIMDQSSLYAHLTAESHMPKIPWRPVAASGNALIIFQELDDTRIVDGERNTEANELVPYDDDSVALSAQSVLNASEYVNGNGFYLYTSNDVCQGTIDNANNTNKEDLLALEDAKRDNLTGNEISKVNDYNFDFHDVETLRFWWKEIIVMIFTSAVLLNFLVGQRSRGEREIVVIERHIPVPTAIEATESSTVALLGPATSNSANSKSNSNNKRSLSESTSNSGENFSSRFQSDFDMMRCLGRGGFGVVFEAKNKLDDCRYAIKRITLPNKEESRVRVMREVKTLANCEHQNIVRYFQSWVEKPPPGWQEEEDSKWLANEFSTSIQIETPTTETYSANFMHLNGCQKIDKKTQLQHWMESATSTACSSDHEEYFNGKDNKFAHGDHADNDESYIVFRSDSHSLSMQSNHRNNDESTEEDDKSSGNCTQVGFRKSQNSLVAIDIHTSGKHIDYSQLSDSFQIEFVRSSNATNSEGIQNEEANYVDNKACRRRPRYLSLDISDGTNNCRELMPMTSKPLQNKVYLYIQMQLCRKESLRDWLRDNKTEHRADYISSIFHQIVDAVDYVHFKGLIHRDLKPSNIFFSQEGQIKIGDFGLVTDMADIPNMITKCGDKTGLPSCARHTQQVGTHLYMSPEQLHGLPYDYKVDIYSLGLIFFELLVYFGTEMERIKTLRSLRDGVYPDEFAEKHTKEYSLLRRMLSSTSEVRPATKELKMQLSEILKIPDLTGDGEAAALAAAAKRLSRSRTFSSCD